MHYFVGKGAFLLPLNVLGLLVGFVSTILYARFLTPEKYGELSFAIATVSVLSFFAMPGITTAMTQSAAQNFDGFFRRGTRVRLRFSLIGVVVVLCVGLVTWQTKGSSVGMAIVLAAGFFPAYYALDGFWGILTGKKEFGRVAQFRILQMLPVAICTWLAVAFTKNVPIILAASIGVSAITNVILNAWVIRHCSTNDRVRPESFGYGKRLSLLSVLMSIEDRIDHVLLGAFLPFHQLGWFNMADRISDAVIKGTWTVTAQMLFPRIAEVDADEAHRRTRVWGVYLVAGFLVLAALFWAFAWVIDWVLGPQYHESVRLAKWLAVIGAISVPWSIFEVYCQARALEKPLWLTRVVVVATHLGTLPWMLQLWGVTGVLISIAISRVACVATSLVLFWRRTS